MELIWLILFGIPILIRGFYFTPPPPAFIKIQVVEGHLLFHLVKKTGVKIWAKLDKYFPGNFTLNFLDPPKE